MPSLEIFLFGQFEVKQNGLPINNPLWQSRQVRLILKYLVAGRGKPLASSQLIELIWPDEDPDGAQRHLYVRISQLRKLLNEPGTHEWIQSVSGGYVFVMPEDKSQAVWIDVDQFEQLAENGRTALEDKNFPRAIELLEEARALYRADYLAEDIYVEWTIGERERLRDLYLFLLTELAEAYAQRGFYRRAINICRQILSIEPCREAVFMRLMLYYYYAGEKGKSLQVFQECQQILMQELGVSVDPTNQQLARRIEEGSLWNQADQPHYPPPVFEGRLFEVPYSLGETPFCGRDREYAWLIQQGQQPEAKIILLEGEAGIGKSRLVEEYCGYLQLQGKRIFKISGMSVANRPYAAWIASLLRDQEQEWFAENRLEEKVNSLIALKGSNRAVDSEKNEIVNLAEHLPQMNLLKETLLALLIPLLGDDCLLVVDDAQFLDLESRDLLAELLTERTTLLICRTEDTPPDHPLRKFLAQMSIEVNNFQLKPVQPEAFAELLAKLGANGILHLGEKLYLATEGNPLFFIATLQHLFEEGILFVNLRGEWECTGNFVQMLPQSIEEVISLRLKQVHSPQRRLLDVIAVAGGEIEYDLLRAALDIEESSLLNDSDKLIDLGLLLEPRLEGSSELCLPHACYQEVIYQSLPSARRKIYHRRLAEAYAKTGSADDFNAALLAHHYHKAEEALLAVRWQQRAGDFALRLYAPLQARTAYQTALTWLQPLDVGEKDTLSAELWVGIAEALRFLGDYRQAIHFYQDAFPWLKDELKTVAAYQIFQLRVLQGGSLTSYDELALEFETALANAGDSWALALLYWGQSFVSLMRGDPQDTRRLNAKAWRVARRLVANSQPPKLWVCQRAFSVLMRAHNQWGNFRTSIYFAKRILQLEGLSDPVENQNAMAAVHASLGESYFNLGQYEKAAEMFLVCQDLAKKAGDPRLQGEALLGLGRINFEKGDFDEAQHCAKQVLCLVDQNVDIPRQVNATLLLTEIEIMQSPTEEAVTLLENYLQLARFQAAMPYCVQILLLLARIKLAHHEALQAEGYAREALELAEKCNLKRPVCTAFRLLAMAKGQLGGLETATRFSKRAIVLARQIESPFEHAQALSNYASWLPDPGQSEQVLLHALQIYEKLGSRFEITHTRQLLQVLAFK